MDLQENMGSKTREIMKITGSLQFPSFIHPILINENVNIMSSTCVCSPPWITSPMLACASYRCHSLSLTQQPPGGVLIGDNCVSKPRSGYNYITLCHEPIKKKTLYFSAWSCFFQNVWVELIYTNQNDSNCPMLCENTKAGNSKTAAACCISSTLKSAH